MVGRSYNEVVVIVHVPASTNIIVGDPVAPSCCPQMRDHRHKFSEQLFTFSLTVLVTQSCLQELSLELRARLCLSLDVVVGEEPVVVYNGKMK